MLNRYNNYNAKTAHSQEKILIIICNHDTTQGYLEALAEYALRRLELRYSFCATFKKY